LAIAKSVAAETEGEPPLVAGNICNTNVYEPGNAASETEVRAMFEEQVNWAAEAGVDFIIAETIAHYGEAKLALQAIKQAGLPAVVTLAVHQEGTLRDNMSVEEGCKRLEQGGADVVGLNCALGPATMLPVIAQVRKAVSCHVAALPVPYRTTPEQPTFQSLHDPACGCIPENRPFPTALDPFTCNRYEMAEFARQAYNMDVRYLGVCCGAGPHHIRSLAEALGRRPPASRYSPDMSKHYALGSDPSLKQHNIDYVEKL
jgi:betaine-homocysteine S-methyltransferase